MTLKRVTKPAKAQALDAGSSVEARATASGDTETFTISDLAKEFAITTRTIRFYESRGLIAPLRVGTSRRYLKRDRARLMLILRGRNLGFTVEDVGDYLALYDADPGQMAQTRLLLEKIEAAIRDLETKRDDIARGLSELDEIRGRCQRYLSDRK